jgi:hypothetical protein
MPSKAHERKRMCLGRLLLRMYRFSGNGGRTVCIPHKRICMGSVNNFTFNFQLFTFI